MANNYSPVPPFNAAVKYFDPNTPSGLTTAGYQQFAQLQAAQGVIPIVQSAPAESLAQPQQPKTGASVFNPNTNTLHVFNGTKWVSMVLA